MSRLCWELAGKDRSGWEGRPPSGYVLSPWVKTAPSQSPIVITYFLDLLSHLHPKFKEKLLSPGPRPAWHVEDAQISLPSNS